MIPGRDSPEDVTEFCITVDSSESPVAAIGEFFPNLRHLILSDSILLSLRDLGTSYQNVQVLELNRCRLADLDGIAAFPNLHSLIAKDNSITDTSQLALHEKLQHLDMEGNAIDDDSALMHLALCPQLRTLNIADTPLGGMDNISALVRSHLPQLVDLVCNCIREEVGKGEDEKVFLGCPPFARHGYNFSQALAGKPHSAGSGNSSFHHGLDSEYTQREDRDFDTLSVSTWDRPDSGDMQGVPADPHKEASSLNDTVVFAGSAALAMRKRRVAGALASPVRTATSSKGCNAGRPQVHRPLTATRATGTDARAASIKRPSSALATSKVAISAVEASTFVDRQQFPEDAFFLEDADDASCSPDGSSCDELSILAVLDAAKLEEEQRKKDLLAELKVWRAGQGQNNAAALAVARNDPQVSAGAVINSRDFPYSSSDQVATAYDDATLVTMLRAKPKHVPQLHSRDNFRRFFAGTAAARMRTLLESAYADIDSSEAAEKIGKRLELLDGVLV